MTRFMIWGGSDNLIEVSKVFEDPDISNLVVEFSVYNPSPEAPFEVHFSDGTILNIWYGDGDAAIWRIEVKEQGSVGIPGAGIVIVPAESEDGIYTDVAFVTASNLEFLKGMCEGEEVLEE